jgi:hypothetical protein
MDDTRLQRPATVVRLTFAGRMIQTGSTSHRLAPARNARPAS